MERFGGVQWDLWESVGAKPIGVDLHFDVVLFCSVWRNAYETLGIGWIYCTGRVCYGSAVGLSVVNLGSSGIKRFDVMPARAL